MTADVAGVVLHPRAINAALFAEYVGTSAGYLVTRDGRELGYVYRHGVAWAHRHDGRGFYGTHRSRAQAVRALVELDR